MAKKKKISGKKWGIGAAALAWLVAAAIFITRGNFSDTDTPEQSPTDTTAGSATDKPTPEPIEIPPLLLDPKEFPPEEYLTPLEAREIVETVDLDETIRLLKDFSNKIIEDFNNKALENFSNNLNEDPFPVDPMTVLASIHFVTHQIKVISSYAKSVKAEDIEKIYPPDGFSISYDIDNKTITTRVEPFNSPAHPYVFNRRSISKDIKEFYESANQYFLTGTYWRNEPKLERLLNAISRIVRTPPDPMPHQYRVGSNAAERSGGQER